MKITVAVILALALLPNAALAQHHPPQDQAIHEKFYNTWTMPDNRSISCCHDEDCSPAETKREGDHWMARKVGDTGNFSPIPLRKEEHERDSPDGRSHVCGRRYGFDGSGSELTVFCFIAGAGG